MAPLGNLAAPTRRKTQHYPVLDGLRGVAALAVVAYHVALYFQLAYLPFHAYLAVDFFFMLSGYVIAYAYDARLAKDMGAGGFLLVRLIRLYPLAILGVGMGTLALVAGTRVTSGLHLSAVLEAGLANLFLLPSSALGNIRLLAFPTDSPLWSLAFEIWINILYAVLFAWLTRRVLIVILVAGAAPLVWAALANGSLNIGFLFTTLPLGAIRVTFPFVAGVLMRRVFADGKRVNPPPAAAHAAFLPLLLVLMGPAFASGVYDAAAVIIAFPAIVYLGTRAPAFARLDRIWSLLGELSYPVYVLHFPVIVVVSNLVHRLNWVGAKLYVSALGTFCLVIALSIAAFLIYDLPLRRYLTKRLIRSQPRVAVQ